MKQLHEFTKKIEHPLIVLGDFNAEPTYESTQWFEKSSGLETSNSSKWFTTFKQRASKELRTIDYVWFGRLRLVGMDKPPTEEEVRDCIDDS